MCKAEFQMGITAAPLLTRTGCSGQTLNLLFRISGAIFTSSCFILRPGDSLHVLPDLGNTDSPASSSHSRNIHVVLVASCTYDLEITTVHPLCGYGLSSRFPPGRDSTNCLSSSCSAVHVLTLAHNKCQLTHCSFTESWEDPQVPLLLARDYHWSKAATPESPLSSTLQLNSSYNSYKLNPNYISLTTHLKYLYSAITECGFTETLLAKRNKIRNSFLPFPSAYGLPILHNCMSAVEKLSSSKWVLSFSP